MDQEPGEYFGVKSKSGRGRCNKKIPMYYKK